MTNSSDLKKKNSADIYKILSLIVIIAILAFAWFLIYFNEMPIVSLPDSIDGIIDVTHVDFSEQIAEMTGKWDFYPNEIFFSEDFEKGVEKEPQNRFEIQNYNAIPYGTHRVTIQAYPNTYYSICGYSVDYSTRVFAGGKEVASVGFVSDEPELSVPRVNYMNFPVYSDEEGKIELIIQYSNFVHKEGGGVSGYLISTPENINRYIINENLPVFILSGGLIVLAAYYLIDFMLRRKIESLKLAFCCLLFAIRDQSFYIVQLIPWDYDWYFHYRIVVIVVMLMPMAILILVEGMYSNLVNKLITKIYILINVIFTVVIFVVPTTEVSPYSQICQYLSIPYLIIFFIYLAKYYYKKRPIDTKDAIMVFAITIILISTTVELNLVGVLHDITRGGITPVSLIAFILLIMSVHSMKSAEDEIAFEQSRKKEEMLEKMNDLKSDFFQKTAHELKTPLTVMSGFAQLTSWQIEEEKTDEETLKNLQIISSEAQRLSNLVISLLDVSAGRRLDAKKEKILVNKILNTALYVCQNITIKNDNEITVECEDEYYIHANPEMMLQLFLNLATNSARYTKSGQIIFMAKKEDKKDSVITFYVSDTGTGIQSEHINHVFEKGYSGDASHGLGLTICKEIVEFHGGEIYVYKTDLKGTTIKFTIEESI